MAKKFTKIAALAVTAVMGCGAMSGLLTACNPASTDSETFTYRSTFSTSPKTWNPHTWEDNTDNIILSYTSMGFYDVQLNDNKDGYEWVAEMASAEPVDVTSSYIGKYGVVSGDTRKVWEISLNQNATWEDGTPIKAEDYVYSMQQLLDPDMLNRRSDSYTSGSFVIYGAKNYLFSKTTATYETVASQGYASIAAAQAAGVTIYFDMWGFYGMEGAKKYVDGVETDEECPEWVDINDETIYLDPVYYKKVAQYEQDVADGKNPNPVVKEDYLVSAKSAFEDVADYYGYDKFDVGGDYEEYIGVYVLNDHVGYGFEGDGTSANSGVGIAATGEYKIIIALTTSITDFNLKYNLASNWLVNKTLYEKCKITTNGVVSSSYGTSLDTSISYGPYKLKTYNLDQYFELEKNDSWYGYTDGKHVGQFETTNIAYYYRTEHTTILNDFLAGTLDDVTLTGDDMQTYGNSSYFYSEPESYTYQFFLCADETALKERDTKTENHSILSLESFRKALSYTMNRASYCSQYDPTSTAGYGLLNYVYIIDPDTGASYRDTDAAKKVILRTNGFTEQTDGTWKDHNGQSYSTLELAYNAVTGYDVEYARELFQQAYDEAREKGLLTDSQMSGDGVVIERGATSETSTGSAMLAWINTLLNEATSGTDLAGKVKLRYNTSYNTSSTFWSAVKSNKLDLAFAGWGGAALSPWSVIYNCYINPDNSFNPSFKTEADSMQITLDLTAYGKGSVTACLTDWAKWLANFQDDDDFIGENLATKLGSLTDASTDLKVEVMAACEEAQLSKAYNLPIFYSTAAALKSAKYKNGSDTYLGPMIGFGGIRHVTYYYSDSEWATFVAQNGNDLSSLYKG